MMRLGSHLIEGLVHFTVWAPCAKKVEAVLLAGSEKKIALKKQDKGYWHGTAESIGPGQHYLFELDGRLRRPDPASMFQPEGVHGPSAVIDHDDYRWRDKDTEFPDLERSFFYELHVGTFTKEGTFAAVADQLDRLKALGVNTLQIMPVAQFPGERNWGYDGVYPYAVQNSYGGVNAFKDLVDRAHRKGFRVFLDVVYNHLGPEGNYLADYGPYFTSKYNTPWGAAINFDDAYSDEVRNYFIENAVYWIKYFHIDGLRLDAVHGIFDMSAVTFLEDLSSRIAELGREIGRKIYLIAESDLNDTRIFSPKKNNGYGLDGVWLDDFHHSLHSLLTGEQNGYYADFGRVSDMAKTIKEGHVYSGQYSGYRKRKHGNSSVHLPGDRFVAFIQNHDQVGNRMLGDRLSTLIDHEKLKLAATCVMLSPCMPMIFMGEEFAVKCPFLYFIDHNDNDLIEAVRNGRKEEFKAFGWGSDLPDPKSPETFKRSVLEVEKLDEEQIVMTKLYKELFCLRSSLIDEKALKKENISAKEGETEKVLTIEMRGETGVYVFLANFGEDLVVRRTEKGLETELLNTASEKWLGPKKHDATRKKGPQQMELYPNSSLLYKER